MHPRDWCCGCGYIRADDFKCQWCHEARPEHYGLDAAVIRWSHRHSRKRTSDDAALDGLLAMVPPPQLACPSVAPRAQITSDAHLIPSTMDASSLADLVPLARSILERLDALLPQLRGGTAM